MIVGWDALEHVQDLALVVTGAGRVCRANGSARDIWGFSAEGGAGTVFELVSHEHHPELARRLKQEPGAEGPAALRVRLLNSAGDVLGAHRMKVLPASPLPSARQEERGIVRLLLMSRERQRDHLDEVSLERERERFEAFFHNANDALFIHDRTGHILEANRVAISLFGYSAEELRERTIGSLHQGGSTNARKNVDLSVGDVLVFDGEFESKFGDVFPARVRVQKVLLGAQQVNVSTVTDTRREALMRAKIIRAEQLETVSRMAGALAHDFNNLLMVALNGALELQESELLHDELQEVVEDVYRAAEQASALASRLTGVARSQQPLSGVTNLSRHLPQIHRMLGTLAGESVNVELHVASRPLRVALHTSQVTQILTNLVTNAAHAMGGRGAVVVTAAPTARGGDECVLLTVRDEGCGMSPEVLSRIFEPLYTTKAGGVGTGLGLASVQAILEQQGGTVDVLSEVGKGTTFELTFPLIVSSVTGPRRSSSESAEGARGRVLVVDDMPAVRGVLERLLRRWGFAVTMAADGQEGIDLIEAYEAGHFSLVLTDMMMPRRSGAEVTQVAFEHDPSLPVVVLTAFSTELLPRGDPKRLRCLSKPVQPGRLRQAIDALLS